MKGYQLLEVDVLDGILGLPTNFDVNVALLSWLVEQLHIELGERLQGNEVEVILAQYHGAYPALGIHYPTPGSDDVGPLVETTIAELLTRRSVEDFIFFLARTPTDWRKTTDGLMAGALPSWVLVVEYSEPAEADRRFAQWKRDNPDWSRRLLDEDIQAVSFRGPDGQVRKRFIVLEKPDPDEG